MELLKENIIGELVAKDYRTASVFKKYGIDFCCQGNRTINEACEKSNVDIKSITIDLNNIIQKQDNKATDYQSWPIDLLADYIEKKHHRYVEEKILEIKPYLNKICDVHGEHHPELLEINEQFSAAAGKLSQHMKDEEQILFPYVREIIKAKQNGLEESTSAFDSVQNPIQMLMKEHDTEGERFRLISKLSNAYTPPEDACNTFIVTFELLKEFEEDLHLHIHLENNILFHKTMESERVF